ncbi:hypothetical protein V6N13_088243 [Hibiscus sabdariffa]
MFSSKAKAHDLAKIRLHCIDLLAFIFGNTTDIQNAVLDVTIHLMECRMLKNMKCAYLPVWKRERSLVFKSTLKAQGTSRREKIMPLKVEARYQKHSKTQQA